MSGEDSLKAEMLPALAQYWAGQDDFNVRFNHRPPLELDIDRGIEEGLARLVRGVVCKPMVETYKKAAEDLDDADDELEIARLEYEAAKWTVGEAIAEGVETGADPPESPVGTVAKITKAVIKAKATQLEYQAAEKAFKRAEARRRQAFAAFFAAQEALRSCFYDGRIYIEADYKGNDGYYTGQGHLEISGARLPANFVLLYETTGGFSFAEAAGNGSYTNPDDPDTGRPPPCTATWSGSFEVGVMARGVDQQEHLVELWVLAPFGANEIRLPYSRDCGAGRSVGSDSFLYGVLSTQLSNGDKFRFNLPKPGQSLVKVVKLDRDPLYGVTSTWRIQLDAPPKSGT
jgi:hypothetical protein